MYHTIVRLSVVVSWLATSLSVLSQDSNQKSPSTIDLTRWKLTTPFAESGSNRPIEISGDQLQKFRDDRCFFESETAAGAIVFRAHCGGVTTKNSSYPRCELREMQRDGQTRIGWSTAGSVTKTLQARVAINQLPRKKRHVVALQIHDSEDDLIMLRFEDKKLFLERNQLPTVMLESNYRLGTPFDIMIVAQRGRIRVNYEGKDVLNWPVVAEGCYFKAGCYTQSNLDKGDEFDAYGEVIFYALSVSETQQSPQLVTSGRLILGTQTNRSASVRTGDFDGDGDLDLVVANGRHWPQQNYLFFNQGKGRYNVAKPLGMELETSYASEVADLDGDGDLDIVIGNDNAPSWVWLGDGDGNFARHMSLGSPTSLRSVTLADVDNDADIDVLMNCRGRPNQIFLNDGKANFNNSFPFGTSSDSTLCVAVADLDRDGHADLVLANRDGQANAILMGKDNHDFAKPRLFGNPKASSRSVVVSDFDNDGHLDWAVGNLGGADEVFLGDGTGAVRGRIVFGEESGNTYALKVADMNGDDRADIVACHSGQSNAVYLNSKSDGDMLPVFRKLEFGADEDATYGCTTGDFDNDGDIDIAVANSGSLNQVFLNQIESN